MNNEKFLCEKLFSARMRFRARLCAVLIAGMAVSLPVAANPQALATVPLTKATTSAVLPNLMFILDNSGSMGRDSVPDWADGNYCKSTSPTTLGASLDCSDTNGNRPPFNNADFNRIYYDPAITYAPPWDATLATPAEKTSYSGTGSTPKDGYYVQSSSTTVLTSNYPDIEYCTDDTYTDCLRNDNYLLPGIVGGKSYTTLHATTASGTKTFATGTVTAPTTASRTVGPFYYVIVPGEFCSDIDQTTCIAATEPTGSYTRPAKVRWCKNSDRTDCKLVQDATYQFVRYPTIVTQAAVAATQSTGKITIGSTPRSVSIGGRTRPTCTIVGGSYNCTATMRDDCLSQTTGKTVVSSIKLVSTNHPTGTEMLTQPITFCTANSSSGTRNSELAAAINNYIGNGFSASRSNAVLTITAPDGTYNSATLSKTISPATLTITQSFGGSVAQDPVAVPGAFKRIDIVPGQTYGDLVVNGYKVIDRSQRADCAAKPNCTYAEELRNFANWYAWYRTRMQMMKTSVSRAFKNIDNRYRVGFITINNASASSNYLKVDTFTSGVTGQKSKWYQKLFAASPGGYTPLRGALSRVGRIFAGKNPLGVSGGDDPMQYSCQQNFALLTTDGYWNINSETTSYSSNDVNGDPVGNLDSNSATRPLYEGPVAVSNSLADIAKYYYDTDLRKPEFGNCTGKPVPPATMGLDVCENNVFVSSTDTKREQHLTTFTLGLGVDGLLNYQSDYRTATSGDFYLLKNGLSKMVGGVSVQVNWPDPKVTNTSTDIPERIDDLWHAAVNGRGVYFSAKNPTELNSGLNEALATIGAKLGSGAAAATSTLNPVAGDNFAYVASYTTVLWTGNLEARSINLDTGEVSQTASWCVENVVSGTCSSPGTVVPSVSGSSTVYNCVTPVDDAAACESISGLGVYDASAGTCSVEMAVGCSGRMTQPGAVAARKIYTKGGGPTTLVTFDYSNLNPADFDATKLSGLSQWGLLSSDQKTTAVGSNLVDFLKGVSSYEDRSSNPIDDRLYRYRSAVLGDPIESQPAYIAKPTFSYSDTGYSEFKNANSSRPGTVYLGANDGMLHAFDAVTGDERWAYIPSEIVPKLWKLADKTYATQHMNLVNGSPVISDINHGGEWRTILVAGLNGGGRSYYALDITNPAAPSLLWEFTTAQQPNLGYTFGVPVVTKRSDGTWVVLVTSGYNNTSPGDGCGYLYVLDAWSGTQLSQYPTGVCGSSGLGRIAVWSDKAEIDNTAGYTYGGDLEGNLWRFDINKAPATAGAILKFAVLKDSYGNTQPITTRPELGKIDGKHVVFVGTGKYLETTDLTTTQVQSLYAIKDPDDYPANSPVATLVDPRTTLVHQVISTDGAHRTSTANPVDWSNDRGWYVDFPESGERQHVDAQLVLGTLLVPTTVPSSTVCEPGGHGWLNYLDYRTGSAHVNSANGYVSTYTNSPIVGINVFYLPSGKVIASVVTSDNPTPTRIEGVGFDSLSAKFQKKRAIWREFIPK